jgi:hypothetical protein
VTHKALVSGASTDHPGPVGHTSPILEGIPHAEGIYKKSELGSEINNTRKNTIDGGVSLPLKNQLEFITAEVKGTMLSAIGEEEEKADAGKQNSTFSYFTKCNC